jgi:hypothetical protein
LEPYISWMARVVALGNFFNSGYVISFMGCYIRGTLLDGAELILRFWQADSIAVIAFSKIILGVPRILFIIQSDVFIGKHINLLKVRLICLNIACCSLFVRVGYRLKANRYNGSMMILNKLALILQFFFSRRQVNWLVIYVIFLFILSRWWFIDSLLSRYSPRYL